MEATFRLRFGDVGVTKSAKRTPFDSDFERRRGSDGRDSGYAGPDEQRGRINLLRFASGEAMIRFEARQLRSLTCEATCFPRGTTVLQIPRHELVVKRYCTVAAGPGS
jgi:hypothetical protein